MGIRFDCPNGHHLNVKAFLAGRRGICPQCGVRLVIPSETSTDDSDLTSTYGVANESIEIKAEQTVATTNSRRRALANRGRRRSGQSVVAASATTDPTSPTTSSPDESANLAVDTVAEESPKPSDTTSHPPAALAESVWYVRPPAGGQYGPANDATLGQWIQEGRIVEETYLWRDGWADWRPAAEVSDQLPVPLARRPLFSPPPTDKPDQFATASADWQSDSESSSARTIADVRRARRRSAYRQWLAAMLLFVLVVVLAGILFWVLRRDTTQAAWHSHASATDQYAGARSSITKDFGIPKDVFA